MIKKFGIRLIHHPSLILQRYHPAAIDPGPTIGGMTHNIWISNDSSVAEHQIVQILNWYKKHRLASNQFEVFELSDDDHHEMNISALKRKVF